MSFQPHSGPDPEEVKQQVDEAIESNDVVLFMKGNQLMPQCGYSAKALELIGSHVDDFETVDVLPALAEYRQALSAHSGWETIPQTFVDGEFVGGSDILEELAERGDLEAELSV
ncbi:MAG: glutaredoxin family protein [Halohasta sp.]